jgi:outer membrane protein assembly factor BamB
MKTNKAFNFLGMILCIGLVACGGGEDSTPEAGSSEQGSGKVNWKFNLGAETFAYYASPALSEDEKTIYIGTAVNVRENASRQDALWAVNRDGSQKWKFNLSDGEEVRSTPVVYDNKVYFTADYRTGQYAKSYTDLFCIDDNGQQLWRKRISGNQLMDGSGLSKVVAYDGKIISVAQDLLVLDAQTGAETYKLEVCNGCNGLSENFINPIINQFNEVVYIYGNALHTFNLTTYEKTSIVVEPLVGGDRVNSTPALDSIGNIYFGSESGQVISLDADGNLRWVFVEGGLSPESSPYIRSSAAIDEVNGVLYVGTKANDSSKFLALYLDSGALKWELAIGRDVYSSPAIDNNGKIYFSSETNYLYAISSEGQEEWKVDLERNVTWSSPAIDSQGNLYIGTMGEGGGSGNGLLYSIKTDSSGLLNGPWSKVHRNNQNTGF